MNALTSAAQDHPCNLSLSGPVAPPVLEVPDRLRPARGLVVGVSVGLGFWAMVGAGVVALVHG